MKENQTQRAKNENGTMDTDAGDGGDVDLLHIVHERASTAVIERDLEEVKDIEKNNEEGKANPNANATPTDDAQGDGEHQQELEKRVQVLEKKILRANKEVVAYPRKHNNGDDNDMVAAKLTPKLLDNIDEMVLAKCGPPVPPPPGTAVAPSLGRQGNSQFSRPGAYALSGSSSAADGSARVRTGNEAEVPASDQDSRPIEPGAAPPSRPEDGPLDTSDQQEQGLSQAFPVRDGEGAYPETEATPFDLEAAERRKQDGGMMKQGGFLLLAAFCLLALGGIFGYALGKNSNQSPGESSTSSVSLAPAPSNSPSEVPSLAPTGVLDLLLQSLSEHTLASLQNFSSPQTQALLWLEAHPDLNDMEETRKTQLFALATFFYAMQGPRWRKEIRERWLLYDKSECFWFTTGAGMSFDNAQGEWGQQENLLNVERVEVNPCDEHGRFQNLHLDGLELVEGFGPMIPPEISLLSTLTSINLESNGIHAKLNDFLPSEMFQMSNLTALNLHSQALVGPIPSELGLLTNLQDLQLWNNQLTGSLPTTLGMFTAMTYLEFWENPLTGTLPTELGLMDSILYLSLDWMAIAGTIPTQLGLLNRMTGLYIEDNQLTGTIPTELGTCESMMKFYIYENQLTGTLPTELGLLTNMTLFQAYGNQLTGSIPAVYGSWTNLTHLSLDANSLSGSIPEEVMGLPNLSDVWLNDNSLTGTIPPLFNGSIGALVLSNNSLTGTVPSEACLSGLFNPSTAKGLSFDCNSELCGCCWCPCEGADNGTSTSNCSLAVLEVFDPATDDEEWPGAFPPPTTMDEFVINIRTDKYPTETQWEWSVRLRDNNTKNEVLEVNNTKNDSWEVLEVNVPDYHRSLVSYPRQVQADACYRLRITDSEGDGTCCSYGFGWFTITNAFPSDDFVDGTVLWNATGEVFKNQLEVMISIDPSGQIFFVKDVRD